MTIETQIKLLRQISIHHYPTFVAYDSEHEQDAAELAQAGLLRIDNLTFRGISYAATEAGMRMLLRHPEYA